MANWIRSLLARLRKRGPVQQVPDLWLEFRYNFKTNWYAERSVGDALPSGGDDTILLRRTPSLSPHTRAHLISKPLSGIGRR